jgi:hypothetical protein
MPAMQANFLRLQRSLSGFGGEIGQRRGISIHILSEQVEQRWWPPQENYVQREVMDWRGNEKCLLPNN